MAVLTATIEDFTAVGAAPADRSVLRFRTDRFDPVTGVSARQWDAPVVGGVLSTELPAMSAGVSLRITAASSIPGFKTVAVAGYPASITLSELLTATNEDGSLKYVVDPTTLEPLQPLPPSASEILVQAAQARDDAQAVAAALPAAAETAIAAEAEAQLVPLVSEAAGQASSAAASKVQAATSAATAGTSATAATQARDAAVVAKNAAEAVPTSNDAIVASLLADRTKQSTIATAAIVNDRVFGGTRKDIRDYGAKMDGILLTNAVTVAGQPTVSSASRAFVTADIGKTIAVMGAGPVVANANDGVWISTILSVASGVATLATNATSSGTGLRCIFGTPDDAAFAAAQNAAAATNGIGFGMSGGTVYVPPGRTIVTTSLAVKNLVSWKGEGREVSWVHSVQDRAGNGGVAGEADWLTCDGRSESNPLVGAHWADFGIEAEAHIHSAGYGSAVKPLNIYHVKRCTITDMHLRNFPATAIPFDKSYDLCSVVGNYIYHPGRLAPAGVGPGGSGIGAGTRGNGSVEPTLIAWNVIEGSQTASQRSPGQNGIFTEAQTGAVPEQGTAGYRIVNNVIIGMYYGISDTGSMGTLIEGNTIIGCGTGVSLRKTTLGGAYPGLHTIITKNTIRGGVGPVATDGIGIRIAVDVAGDSVRGSLHTIIEGNQIIDNQSWGISVLLTAAGGVDVAGLMVQGNSICRNGLSGIRIASESGRKFFYPSIKDNQCVGNGLAGTSGDQAAILVVAGTRVEGGRIQDNDCYDLKTVPTQLEGVAIAGVTFTNVTVSGNTGDVASTVPRALVLTSSGADTVGLSWQAPYAPGATDYTIQYRLPESGTWTTFAHTASTSTSATIAGLKKGHTYDFRVASVIAGVTSDFTPSKRGTAGIPPAIDRFNRATASLAGVTLPDGTASPVWALETTASGVLSSVTGGSAQVAKTTSGGTVYALIPNAGTVGAVQAKIHAVKTDNPANRRHGVVFAHQSATNGYRIDTRPSSTVLNLGLRKILSGAVTVLSEYTRQAVAGDIVRVEFDSGTKRLAWYVNEEFVGAVTDPDFTYTGFAGLYGDYSNDTLSSADDFMAWI